MRRISIQLSWIPERRNSWHFGKKKNATASWQVVRSRRWNLSSHAKLLPTFSGHFQFWQIERAPRRRPDRNNWNVTTKWGGKVEDTTNSRSQPGRLQLLNAEATYGRSRQRIYEIRALIINTLEDRPNGFLIFMEKWKGEIRLSRRVRMARRHESDEKQKAVTKTLSPSLSVCLPMSDHRENEISTKNSICSTLIFV